MVNAPLTAAINDLRHQLSGYILQAGDVQFESAVKIDNGRITLRPLLIVRPTVVEDVSLAFKFAVGHQLPFTVKGGGHSAAGYCLNDGGLVIDMKHLNKVTFNKKTESLTAQMGVIWYDLYKFMLDTGTGLIPIGGGCPTVAPPGFMQGGGYSFVSRSYGMSVDSLLSVKIVMPDGQLRDIGINSTSQEDIDIFWAIRGGGGGNWGIIIEMEMQMHKPNSATMLVGQIRYHLEQTEEVLGYYNQWVETLPPSMSCYGFIGQQPDLVSPTDPTKNVKVIGLTPVFNGECAEGLDLLDGLLKLNPINTSLYNMTLPNWEFMNGYVTLVANRSAYMRSLILPKGGMNNEVAKVIVDYMKQAPSPASFAVWTLLGGKIADKAPDDTAYYHRNARFVPEVKSIWNRENPGEALANVQWAYEFFEAMRVAGDAVGAYVNYIDPLLHDWAKMYYGDNYERLVRIKKQVDPKNLFNFQQSIGSDFNPPAGPLKDISPLNRTQIK